MVKPSSCIHVWCAAIKAHLYWGNVKGQTSSILWFLGMLYVCDGRSIEGIKSANNLPQHAKAQAMAVLEIDLFYRGAW